MVAGGNKRLLDFLEVYGLASLGLEKYYTKAAEHYRQSLRAEVDGVSLNLSFPTQEVGREYFIEPPRHPNTRSDEFEAFARHQAQQKSPGFLKNASNFISSTASRASELASTAASRVREHKFVGKVKSTASSVIQKTKNIFGSDKVRPK
mmetsp:Transcript_13577/g.25624  ORF Transcript_13577/g.25624 Transcript_13577/m.25624 type:complete len:149 (+) Transcript_13577:260-706(+)